MNANFIYVNELWTMTLYSDFSVKQGSVQQLTNPCYDEQNGDYQHYYVYPEYTDPNDRCTEQGPDTSYGDYDPKISPDGQYIVFERHIGASQGSASDWDIIVVKIGLEPFDHTDPKYDETIWNVTHHFDGGYGYSWSTEFLPHWKLVGGPVYDLTYTVLATLTAGNELDNFYDQFKQGINLLEAGGYITEREKRPIETPDRLDNLLDERGIWFPDGTELLFFREIGTPLNEEEQAKRLPARKW